MHDECWWCGKPGISSYETSGYFCSVEHCDAWWTAVMIERADMAEV